MDLAFEARVRCFFVFVDIHIRKSISSSLISYIYVCMHAYICRSGGLENSAPTLRVQVRAFLWWCKLCMHVATVYRYVYLI